MTNLFEQGLLITAIGMGLVFVVIIFLWGLMAALMRLTSKEKKAKGQAIGEVETDPVVVLKMEAAEVQRRVVAAALAVAKAIEATQRRFVEEGDSIKLGSLSPWQTAHRSRQLENRR
jgi:Na+-transporting methylmalonyl-CoA/oxaloacetate decarboxylase gamma subunit